MCGLSPISVIYIAYLLVGFCYAAYLGFKINFSLDAFLTVIGLENVEIDEETKLKFAPLLIVVGLVFVALTWPLHWKDDEPNAS